MSKSKKIPLFDWEDGKAVLFKGRVIPLSAKVGAAYRLNNGIYSFATSNPTYEFYFPTLRKAQEAEFKLLDLIHRAKLQIGKGFIPEEYKERK